MASFCVLRYIISVRLVLKYNSVVVEHTYTFYLAHECSTVTLALWNTSLPDANVNIQQLVMVIWAALYVRVWFYLRKYLCKLHFLHLCYAFFFLC